MAATDAVTSTSPVRRRAAEQRLLLQWSGKVVPLLPALLRFDDPKEGLNRICFRSQRVGQMMQAPGLSVLSFVGRETTERVLEDAHEMAYGVDLEAARQRGEAWLVDHGADPSLVTSVEGWISLAPACGGDPALDRTMRVVRSVKGWVSDAGAHDPRVVRARARLLGVAQTEWPLDEMGSAAHRELYQGARERVARAEGTARQRHQSALSALLSNERLRSL